MRRGWGKSQWCIRHQGNRKYPGVMWLVSDKRSQVWMGSMCVKFGVIALNLSYWPLEVQHIAKAIKRLPRPWNWAAARWPRPYSSLTRQVPLRTGLAMVDQWSWVQVLSVISRSCVLEIDVLCCQHCCRAWRGGGSACQCSDHTPHTASNCSAWLSSQKEASSKDDAQESPQTVCWRQAD